MSWWAITLIALSSFGLMLWLLDGPITYRALEPKDFPPYFETLLVAARIGAWMEISDADYTPQIVFRKNSDNGSKIRVTIPGRKAVDLEQLVQQVERESEGRCALRILEDSEFGGSLEICVDPDRCARSASAAAVSILRFFSPLGSQVFHIRLYGRPDPEGWRPLFESLARWPSRSGFRRWGRTGLRELDRRRNRTRS